MSIYENKRSTIRMGVRHIVHPRSDSATVSVHLAQKRACPHGTRATPSRGWSRHTSQQLSGSEDAATDTADPAVEVVALSISVSALSAVLSSELLSWICSGWACMTLWLIARRNCICVYSPLSYLATHFRRRQSFCSCCLRRRRRIGSPFSNRCRSLM